MNDDLINREDKFRALIIDNIAIGTDIFRFLLEITECICRLIDEYKKQGYLPLQTRRTNENSRDY